MKTKEFVVEIGCEEIPADWLGGLIRQFEQMIGGQLFRWRLGSSDLSHVRGYGTPRRLIVHARKVRVAQPDQPTYFQGPPIHIGRAEDGTWTRAALGFAKRHGIAAAELDKALTTMETPRGTYVAVHRVVRGRSAEDMLPRVLEDALRALTFPKTMRWDATIGGEPFPFGRPIRWIVTIFGGTPIPFQIDVAGGQPVVAGRSSRGHRFHAHTGTPGAPFDVDSFEMLEAGLRRRFVLIDPDERRGELMAAVMKATSDARYAVDSPPPGAEHLVEWPGAVYGRYPESFAGLPVEIRHAVLVGHQKYLPAWNEKCAFVAIVNRPTGTAADPPNVKHLSTEAIRRGAERVVNARLRDAQFFWDEDRRIRLGERDLSGVLFHKRLGSFESKTERLVGLADSVSVRVRANRKATTAAAQYAKRDLVTALVGEFAGLQGIAGGLLLREEGVSSRVSRAVYEHYRPAGLDGPLPTTREGIALALADNADTLAGLTLAGERVTGSGDPFGLRRAAFSLIRLLADGPAADRAREWLTPTELFEAALSEYNEFTESDRADALTRLLSFFDDRLHHAFERQSPREAVRAVLSGRSGILHVADARQRVVALAAVQGSEDFGALSVAANRVRRILPREQRQTRGEGFTPDRLIEPAEVSLHAGLVTATQQVQECFQRGDYPAGLTHLAALRPPVDRFFDDVLVMAEEADLRQNRLALLARLDALFSEVGDLSQIEASAS